MTLIEWLLIAILIVIILILYVLFDTNNKQFPIERLDGQPTRNDLIYLNNLKDELEKTNSLLEDIKFELKGNKEER